MGSYSPSPALIAEYSTEAEQLHPFQGQPIQYRIYNLYLNLCINFAVVHLIV